MRAAFAADLSSIQPTFLCEHCRVSYANDSGLRSATKQSNVVYYHALDVCSVLAKIDEETLYLLRLVPRHPRSIDLLLIGFSMVRKLKRNEDGRP